MHYHLEVIIPPVENVEAALEQILQPFNEQSVDEEGDRNTHTFWDWYVVGGRWAGAKMKAMLDQEKLKAFHEELSNRKVTVSGVRAGKQKLEPEGQIPMVDALWNEYFPDSPIKVCPLFQHFNNKYHNSDGFPDIMRLKDMPKDLTASRVMIAGPSWRDNGTLKAEFMVQNSMWNGVNHVDAKWDGSVQTAIQDYKKRLGNYKPEYAAKHMPQDDWLVVTVDYHS